MSNQHSRRSDGGPWIGGLVLILLGIVFLLQNIDGFRVNNWWALFILFPAFGSLAVAWNTRRTSGRFTRAARSEILSGVILLLVTATFLFNLNWNVFLPILLIVLGLGMLINYVLPD
jgi:peptidoglycan/LPS O-acetylase OafA/YrhL